MSELGQQLIKIVRHKADLRPDFVYQPPLDLLASQGHCDVPGPCLYIHDDGQAGCLIGQALFELGLIDASLADNPINRETIRMLAEKLELPLDADEIQWLREVQRNQDMQHCWAVAVSRADERYYP